MTEIAADIDAELDQNVPKSASSSSGVNEISDSSNDSAEQYQKRMEEVAEKEKSGDIPSFKDMMDLLKFAYILQVRNYFAYIMQFCTISPHTKCKQRQFVLQCNVKNLLEFAFKWFFFCDNSLLVHQIFGF